MVVGGWMVREYKNIFEVVAMVPELRRKPARLLSENWLSSTRGTCYWRFWWHSKVHVKSLVGSNLAWSTGCWKKKKLLIKVELKKLSTGKAAVQLSFSHAPRFWSCGTLNWSKRVL